LSVNILANLADSQTRLIAYLSQPHACAGKYPLNSIHYHANPFGIGILNLIVHWLLAVKVCPEK